MKSILVTYPGFRTLPRGIKMLLVTSENFFFHEPQTAPAAALAEILGIPPLQIWDRDELQPHFLTACSDPPFSGSRFDTAAHRNRMAAPESCVIESAAENGLPFRPRSSFKRP